MISLARLNSSSLFELIRDLLNKSKGVNLVQFSTSSRLNKVLQQGFGTSYGKKTLICDVKTQGLSENDILIKGALDSNSLFNEY